MPDFLRMGIVLMVVGLVATAILSTIESVTRDPIAEAKRQETLRMLKMVLPEGFDNEPVSDTVLLADKRLNSKEKPVIFYRGRKGSTDLGAAYVVTAPDGYSGDIEIMMSVLPAGTIHLVQIVAHKETPGLGDKIMPDKGDWLKKFTGKNSTNIRWGVKKDGGDFDQFAGATITPRAVVNAVKRGLDFFVEKKDLIFQPAKQEKKP
ncbi:MAG: electron transport complex subunit RsxG [Magnetococcales bacterium]|nr:electron transport complex subunit RsxG [Magnetococcales bacterium]